MEPTYFVENKFFYRRWVRSTTDHYVAEQPETQFELDIASRLAQGHRHFGREEYRLALQKYREAAWMILKVADPEMPPWPPNIDEVALPYDKGLIEVMMQGVLAMIENTPIPEILFPNVLFDFTIDPPLSVTEKLAPYVMRGLKDSKFPAEVSVLTNQAAAAAEKGQWENVVAAYKLALDYVTGDPSAGLGNSAAIKSALGAAYARQKDFDAAAKTLKSAVIDFRVAEDSTGELIANRTLLWIYKYQEDERRAAAVSKEIERLEREVSAIEAGSIPRRSAGLPVARLAKATRSSKLSDVASLDYRAASVAASALSAEVSESAASSSRLLGTPVADSVGIQAGKKVINFAFDDAKFHRKFVSGLYSARVETADLAILGAYLVDNITFVAYLPHVYFFVIPMCIGDVYAEMGEHEEAIEQYKSVLAYPYLNQNIEAVQVWLKIALAYLDWGDALFRQSKVNPATLSQARNKYEKIVKNNAPPSGSPLYNSSHFQAMKARVRDILDNVDDLEAMSEENPQVIAVVHSALEGIFKLDHDLNFYGFHRDYIPPFTFEYLQNVARYFAQHAVQAERDYINFKTNAENTTFTRMQLQQNLALADASVELERRRVVEAQTGVAVVQASVDLTRTQVEVAYSNANDFRRASPALQELTELESWASAAAVDQDDEILQTVSGYSYYHVESKRRSEVVAELAHRRTRLTQALEQRRLDGNVSIAQGYLGMAQAQLAQAQQRVRVAEQGLNIALMRRRDAADNLSYFSDKEFNEGMWCELAIRMRRIARHYLDYAIEIGLLMERAYEAETGRALNVIRFDYDRYDSAGILAGDYLLRDIDCFTADRIISTRTKQSPIKQVFSLADNYPYALVCLKETGECIFETTLAQFDEAYPGTYLQKVKSVELVVVGEVSPMGIRGTLRNIGISTYRDEAGNVRHLVYPSDTLMLSQYELRNDLLVFRPVTEELRLFENNGPATMWHLRLPRRANDLDFSRLLDVQVVIYYQAFYSPAIEKQVIAALPASGSSQRGISLRTEYPDELYFLAREGQATIAFEPGQFPGNQKNQRKKRVYIRFAGKGAGDGAGITFRLFAPATADPLILTTDAEGSISTDPADPTAPLNQLIDHPLFEEWKLVLDPTDNPDRVRRTEGHDRVDISNIRDIQILLDYDFDYLG